MSQSDVHVAVLMGGWSAEREVSLDSGEGCAGALERAGYRVTRVDVKPDIAQVLSELKPDVAFNALHGRWGEDGCMQGVLEILKIPYTHSGVLASSLAMHKEKAKEMYRSVGIPVAEAITADRLEAGREHLMAPPYVVKPVAEGSSVGVLDRRGGPGTPAAGTLSGRLALWRRGHGRALHSRARTDLRGDGRHGARHHRCDRGNEIL